MTALTTEGLLKIIEGKDQQIKKMHKSLEDMISHAKECLNIKRSFSRDYSEDMLQDMINEIDQAEKLLDKKPPIATGKKIVKAQDGDYGMILDADGNKVNSKWAQANLETGLVREYETVSKLVDKIYKKPLRFIPVSDPEYVELMSQPKPTNNRK